MKIHDLKCNSYYFELIANGSKRFEFRKNDRDFELGDILVLREFDTYNSILTGRVIQCVITFVLPSDNEFHDLSDYVILSLSGVVMCYVYKS